MVCEYWIELMIRVRSIHMSPADDSFISSGDDMTVRLWDLRTPVCRVSPYNES